MSNKLSDLIKELSLTEKLFLISGIVMIVGLALPIIQIPLLGNFNALNSGWGAAYFFLVIGVLGLFFWKKEYSKAGMIVLSGLGIFQIIYAITSLGGFTIDLGFLGEMSLFTFLGIGAYILTIGLIASGILAILLLKEHNNSIKLFVISVVVLIILCGVDIAYNQIEITGDTINETDFEIPFDLGTTEEELETKTFSLGDTITYSGVELTFTTLEKAMHSKFTDFETDVEYYRITYTMKNTNSERITPCSFDFILLDSNGHQIDDGFSVMDDGDSLYDDIFSDVQKNYRKWFETANQIEGDISIYIKPAYVTDETCPNFEIKLEVPESEVVTPSSLTLLGEQVDDVTEEITCPTMSNAGTFEFNYNKDYDFLRLYADFLTNAKFSEGWELSYKPSPSEYSRDSFSCEKGNVEGENTNYLYCTSFSYRPTLKKNTIDEEGNIVNTDYLYVTSFIFDAKGKDVTNTEDLKSLSFEGIICSESYY